MYKDRDKQSKRADNNGRTAGSFRREKETIKLVGKVGMGIIKQRRGDRWGHKVCK